MALSPQLLLGKSSGSRTWRVARLLGNGDVLDAEQQRLLSLDGTQGVSINLVALQAVSIALLAVSTIFGLVPFMLADLDTHFKKKVGQFSRCRFPYSAFPFAKCTVPGTDETFARFRLTPIVMLRMVVGVLIFMVVGGVLFTGYRFYQRRANAGPQPHHHVQRPPGASPGRYEMSPFSKGFDEDDEDGFV